MMFTANFVQASTVDEVLPLCHGRQEEKKKPYVCACVGINNLKFKAQQLELSLRVRLSLCQAALTRLYCASISNA